MFASFLLTSCIGLSELFVLILVGLAFFSTDCTQRITKTKLSCPWLMACISNACTPTKIHVFLSTLLLLVYFQRNFSIHALVKDKRLRHIQVFKQKNVNVCLSRFAILQNALGLSWILIIDENCIREWTLTYPTHHSFFVFKLLDFFCVASVLRTVLQVLRHAHDDWLCDTGCRLGQWFLRDELFFCQHNQSSFRHCWICSIATTKLFFWVNGKVCEIIVRRDPT